MTGLDIIGVAAFALVTQTQISKWMWLTRVGSQNWHEMLAYDQGSGFCGMRAA